MPRPGGPTPSDPGAGYTLDWEDPADQDFSTSERLYGWKSQYQPDLRHSDGSPQVRIARAPDEPVRNGGHSVRFHLESTDPIHSGGARAEFAASPLEPVGVERWYGFSIHLEHGNWEPDPAPDSVTQWHQASDTGGSPPLSLWTRDGRYVIVQAGRPGRPNAYTDAGPCQPGLWTDWVVHVRWSKQATGADAGVLEIWRDGSPVPGVVSPDVTDSATNTTAGNYMKIGIYKWPWSDKTVTPPSSEVRRVMFHDEVRIADHRGSYELVRPRG